MSMLQQFIDKPVQATVISLVIALLGIQAMMQLNVRQYPETVTTTLTVVTPYIGADAELVRGFITTPLEQAIATMDGIEYLKSASSQGQSVITVRLVLNYDPNDAVAQILTKIQQVRNQLPQSAENSIVTVSTGSDQAAMYLAFFSDVLDATQISDYLTRAVRPRLETLQGVQEAEILGAQSIALRVWLDSRKMAALGISASEVRDVLADNNFLAAIGNTKGSVLSISLETSTDLESVDAFRNMVIREEEGSIIRLSDVAQVSLGAENYESSVMFNDRTVVFVGVSVTPTANLLDAVGGVKALLPDIYAQLPAALEGIIVYDSTVAIEDSINEVIDALIEALLIVTVVIFFFLGALRSALVPGIAMPLAIIGAFFIMQMLGYSINLLTLLALILAIGTVVDDGIVIAENAMRHIEAGATPNEAAKQTADELSGSIVAMNIVVLAVFAPIGLMGGLTGTLFTEFAYTVAGATLVSGVIALTLSPMMCAKLLQHNMKRRRSTQWVDSAFKSVSDSYHTLLSKTLDRHWLVLGIGGLILISVYFLYTVSERELAPVEDDGFLMVTAQGDPNMSIDQLERWTSLLADNVGRFRDIEHVFMMNNIGPQNGSSASALGGLSLKDWSKRDQTQMELQPQVQQLAAQNPGLQAAVISLPSLPGATGGTPVQFIISAIDDPMAVFANAEALARQARQSGLFTYIQSDLKFDRLQYRIDIDRDKAAAVGIDMRHLGDDLATMLSNNYVNFFSFDGRSYRVVPQVERQYRLQAEQLMDYYIASDEKELIPLSAIATLTQRVEPRQLLRFNQLNSATLSAVPVPGITLGHAVEYLQQQADTLLPGNYMTDWTGESRQYVTEGSALLFSFALAVMFMYLTLSAQYNSFRDPAVMLVSVPMSLAGALIFFAFGVVSVNIYTQIGLLALVGSIIRHGILLVEFANDLQLKETLNRREAMEKAASLRLRSILMTTLATLFGLIPLLVAASGPGAESRFAISFTLGVGMAIGTVFTLFVVPSLYTVLATDRHKQAGHSR
ncbi:multidrug efflux pump [Nitrosomonas sp. Nm51]|uniref:efflux RND transporter permease subunit n=1 Tax=Nitrosomonas sp. Nm51 TaxID=133720 RepID=UPI0008B23E0E|nr:efflux RND transporter permease subunit [Nitrosomonas sp. Nm51]SER81389.1 multidrug efflux pump [Nitrosomonas sp. Nm51]